MVDYNKIYEEILPYLSDPHSIRDLLDEHKDASVDSLIADVNKTMATSEAFMKTDLRILLNALEKHS
jgi:hypothetical protein